ncbi:MAG: hypothetical protein U1F76_03040 [Candidatus Competibacteraceae bacterium]
MPSSKFRYLIGVVLFLLLAGWSLFEAFQANNQQLVTLIVAVLGYFIFMVVDRLEITEAIEKLQAAVLSLSQPLNQLKGDKLLATYGKDVGRVQRLSSIEAFEYTLSKVRSARCMYNTSFSNFEAISGGPYYNKWLEAIVDGVTESSCLVHEVMSSRERLDVLRNLFKSKGAPLKGSYIGYELSSLPIEFRHAPFTEFSIFENLDGSSEVIFGWTTSSFEFLGNDCFVVADKHVVEYFLKLFKRFQSLAKPGFLDK